MLMPRNVIAFRSFPEAESTIEFLQIAHGGDYDRCGRIFLLYMFKGIVEQFFPPALSPVIGIDQHTADDDLITLRNPAVGFDFAIFLMEDVHRFPISPINILKQAFLLQYEHPLPQTEYLCQLFKG